MHLFYREASLLCKLYGQKKLELHIFSYNKLFSQFLLEKLRSSSFNLEKIRHSSFSDKESSEMGNVFSRAISSKNEKLFSQGTLVAY